MVLLERSVKNANDILSVLHLKPNTISSDPCLHLQFHFMTLFPQISFNLMHLRGIYFIDCVQNLCSLNLGYVCFSSFWKDSNIICSNIIPQSVFSLSNCSGTHTKLRQSICAAFNFYCLISICAAVWLILPSDTSNSLPNSSIEF